MTPTAADPALRDSFVGLVRALAGAHDLDPDDLEQQVWLRASAEPRVSGPTARLRALTVQEFRRAAAERRTAAESETAAGLRPRAAPPGPEQQALAAERERVLRAAVARLPGRCAGLVTALLESPGYSYRELAEELSMPLGSIGPTRARCLACLRRAWQVGRVLQPE